MRLIVSPTERSSSCRGCGCSDLAGCEVLASDGTPARCWWVEPDLCSACVQRLAAPIWSAILGEYLDDLFHQLTSHTMAELVEAYESRGYVPTFRFDWGDGLDRARRFAADAYDVQMLGLGLGAKCRRPDDTLSEPPPSTTLSAS